ncbi:MAG: GGDEF domain-containing protein [Candidatus Marsarchaeota archaeon]|nr:GGDEF domain-containing protein [Candidatus Marsarchaeota archaeon]MCL5094728.1 GGDEF domain-containing protein [Candidatus Marsarchaeota archaeon]
MKKTKNIRKTKLELEILMLKQKLKESKNEMKILKKNSRKFERLALLDPLTKAGNRNLLKSELIKNFDIALRENSDFGLILIDLDNLKIINDRKGHNAGDNLIKNTINTLKHRIRQFDVLCRIGGDEFIIILFRSNLTETENISKQLREILKEQNISASFGYSSLREVAEKKLKVINKTEFSRLFKTLYFKIYKKADERLYKEKNLKKIQ